MTVILEPPTAMYRCWIVVDKFDGHEQVTLTFYHAGSKREGGAVLPYDQLIENYFDIPEDMRSYPESAVDEMFRWAEVEVLADYLAKYYKSTLRHEEVKLPIPNNIMGWTAQPFTRGMGLCPLRQPDRIYTPTFEVSYGYDHRFCGCERCQERDREHERQCWICGN